ncbi:PTS system, galactitol-specific IIA component [Enterococcus sp. DIV0755b]|uniref:PTS galactitol transporter subunit IIA n=1 Tax=Enterococcus canintestini TaxID=317010 RepID=A0A267HTI8_9ENTE|nr:PTS sugar transporter subunit IIA [Enterococcus canintestini]PAB01527.1 PTS galactitol transporter subunit IIA [Enterococcus canintestini]
MELYLHEELVFRDLDVKNSDEALDYLAKQLFEKGYVKEQYITAIKEREREYPTGLPSTQPAVAIPHANYELVNKTTLAIATLKKSVGFHNMEENAVTLPVQIIIMMAIGEPHGQVEMLQKIVGLIQNEPLRKKMINAHNDQELLKLVEMAIQ